MKLVQRLVISICVAAMALAASPAFASQARIDAMGGGVKLWTVDDESNIFDFPALLTQYGDMVLIDNITATLDANGDPLYPNMRFGYHAQLGDNMVLAIYGGAINSTTRPVGDGFDAGANVFTGGASLAIGGEASGVGLIDSTGGTGLPDGGPSGLTQQGGDAANNVDLKIGLMYAVQIGDSIRMGLMLNILRDNGDIELPEGVGVGLDRGAWLADIALGFGVDMESMQLDFGLGIAFGGFEDNRDDAVRVDTNNDGVWEPQVTALGTGVAYNPGVEHWAVDSHLAFNLNARLVTDFFAGTKLVPYLRFAYSTQSVTNVRPFSAPDNSSPGVLNTRLENGSWNAIDFMIGTDMRIEPFENVTVSPGLGFRVRSQTLEGIVTDVVPGAAQTILQDYVNTPKDGDLLISAPYYGVAVDVKIWDWLDFRFGASQSVDFLANKQTDVSGITAEQNESRVVTHIATGLGFNFPVQDSMLSIDINVNPLHWLSGPAIITGDTPLVAGNTDGWGMSGAIKYDW